MTYDLIIIGGGPAGAAAGVYSARKKIKSLLITPEWGGQSNVSLGIENWIGTKKISGDDFANSLKEHVLEYAGDSLEVKSGEAVNNIEKLKEGNIEGFSVTTDKSTYNTRTVLIATGSYRRKLEVPGAAEYENKGIVYCASCDGPLFADQDVVVVGGGNAAFETAAQLLAYCKSVTLLNRSETFRADEITVDSVRKNPKMTIITNAEIKEVKGDKFVTGVIYKDKKSGENKELAVTGVFVEIGLLPTTYFTENAVDLNDYKQVKIDPRTQRTSTPGIWAAGDCTDTLFHQNNIAAGDAVKALEDIYLELHKM